MTNHAIQLPNSLSSRDNFDSAGSETDWFVDVGRLRRR
jgi:hypothetical protein